MVTLKIAYRPHSKFISVMKYMVMYKALTLLESHDLTLEYMRGKDAVVSVSDELAAPLLEELDRLGLQYNVLDGGAE